MFSTRVTALIVVAAFAMQLSMRDDEGPSGIATSPGLGPSASRSRKPSGAVAQAL
jgi:hypothetical protein